ncbi:MAG: penicillin-binding transpeptidase domain-containing protein [Eubacteriales bacterium]
MKNQGNDVVTTLDMDLQRTAYDALGKNRGAVVVLEASTGRVLAMVSKPDYNPGTINEKWDTLTAESSSESGSVLYNRVTQDFTRRDPHSKS